MRSSNRRRARRPNLSREELDAIPLWVEMGARGQDIADALGIGRNSLYNLCARNNISLRPSGGYLATALSPKQWEALRVEAVKRGLSVPKLVVLLVGRVSELGLFTTVLRDCNGGLNEHDGRDL